MMAKHQTSLVLLQIWTLAKSIDPGAFSSAQHSEEPGSGLPTRPTYTVHHPLAAYSNLCTEAFDHVIGQLTAINQALNGCARS